MEKIEEGYIKNQYKSGVERYAEFTRAVGLWESEQYALLKYLKKENRLLDLGCGTGRTSFPLFALGFENLVAIDLTPEMIEKARELDQVYQTGIEFQVGNAKALIYADDFFDAVIFSFNGLMSIPKQENRDQALAEIYRVLKPARIFIFTTHDRGKEPQFLEFWKAEKIRWEQGQQNPALFQFGDLLTSSKNEDREIYIHIPAKEEVQSWLEAHQFTVLETFYRSDRFQEIAAVKNKSGECRFWIAKSLP